MQLYTIDPLSDGRWRDFVAGHPQASVFHRTEWLAALKRTYGYEPFVLTSAGEGSKLRDGIPLCRVSSWLTGRRLVSVPFADHCEPLLQEGTENDFAEWLRRECDNESLKYAELRPLIWSPASGALVEDRKYYFHTLDLSPPLEQIFRGLHKDSLQRRIRKAEREQLHYETGRSEKLLDDFYRLVVITRKRQRSIPQPRIWFKNLMEAMGEDVQIRVASKNGTALAAMLTLRHGKTAVYKYGGSDERFHNLAAMPFLFWKLIEESKASGLKEIDFGRSDMANAGLVTFKDRFGTQKKILQYYRYSKHRTQPENLPSVPSFVSMLPNIIFSAAGRLLYRHMG